MNEMESYLGDCLKKFTDQYSLDLIIPQNVLAIPMHVPMGLAVTNLSKKGIPTVAHHHDFYWERDRFLKGCAGEYLDKAFPPPITEMFEHVVINSGAKRSLKERLGVESTVIPNVFDFENPPVKSDGYGDDFKKEEGLIIPKTTNFKDVGSLSNEIVEKLIKIQPPTLGAASRISGVTPAAIIAIMRYLKKLNNNKAA